jgi:hypothetical protein
MGQFYFYFTDTVYMLVLNLAVLSGTASVSYNIKDIAAFVKPFEFGILSTVHCLLIPDLRSKFFKFVDNTFIFKKFRNLCPLHHK